MPLKKFEVIQPKYESYCGNPLPRFFYVLERLLKDVDIPGARILMLLGLVLVAWFVILGDHPALGGLHESVWVSWFPVCRSDSLHPNALTAKFNTNVWAGLRTRDTVAAFRGAIEKRAREVHLPKAGVEVGADLVRKCSSACARKVSQRRSAKFLR